MSIIYKFDVLTKLKSVGYSTYKIRNEKIFGEATLQKLRNNQSISLDSINEICRILNCQPGDILEYVPDDKAASDDANIST